MHVYLNVYFGASGNGVCRYPVGEGLWLLLWGEGKGGDRGWAAEVEGAGAG